MLLILVDREAVSRLNWRTEIVEGGEVWRYYCAAKPDRAIVVMRNGFDLATLAGTVVEAQVDVDLENRREIVRAGNEGKRHVLVSVTRKAKGQASRRLSEILAGAPKDGVV